MGQIDFFGDGDLTGSETFSDALKEFSLVFVQDARLRFEKNPTGAVRLPLSGFNLNRSV